MHAHGMGNSNQVLHGDQTISLSVLTAIL